MTPQELMDLPFAGMAEKELRRTNKWSLTEKEKLSKVFDRLQGVHYELEGAMYGLEEMTQ